MMTDAELRVHADGLLEKGDPRGELILLSLDGKSPELVEQRQRELFARWAKPPAGITIDATWRHGYWDALRFGAKPEMDALPIFGQLMADPSARFLRELTVDEFGLKFAKIDAFLPPVPKTVRVLTLGTQLHNYESIGDLAALRAFTELEVLTLGVIIDEGTALPARKLRVFRHRTYTTQPKLGLLWEKTHFPALEELELVPNDFNWSDPETGGFFKPGNLPKLYRLTMRYGGHWVIRGLIASGLLPQLETLELPDARFGQETADIIARDPQLKRLGLARYSPSSE
jgi:hypothetical protein